MVNSDPSQPKGPVAWLYVALTEAEYKIIFETYGASAEHFLRGVLSSSGVFALPEDSTQVIFQQLARDVSGLSPSGDRSHAYCPISVCVEYTVLELVRGTRYNDTSDTNWRYWGISISARPGHIPNQKTVEQLEKFLESVGVTADRFQKAFFLEGTAQAYIDLDGAANNL